MRQVQVASDNAKFIAGRLAGKEWPSHPDTETTFEQLRARLASVIGYLDTFTREDFDQIEARKVKLPWMKPDQYLSAYDYLVGFGLPNFYFHVVTAYAILRHKGVKLGKQDLLARCRFSRDQCSALLVSSLARRQRGSCSPAIAR